MNEHRVSRELTLDTRLCIIQDLLARSSDGVLKRGTIQRTAEKFKITRKTVSKYWERYSATREDGNVLDAVKSHNAPAHVSEQDYQVVGNGQRYGWDISMRVQPPNSPDLNVLDLGFFRAIQSASQDYEMDNMNDVVKYVTKAFNDMNPWALNDVFLSLFKHMEASMEVKGGNFYKEPHSSKAKRRNAGVEQVGIVYCDSDVYDSAVALVETGFDE